MNKLTHVIFLLVFLVSGKSYSQLAGQECFPEQRTDRLVYDSAELLSASEQKELENQLDLFAVNTSNEIFLVIVPDLCGMDKAQFATELGEKWGAGQKQEDNGIVLLIKPKTNDSKGEIFIAVGRGLEGAIPDATAHLIIENEVLPSFRNGQMYLGIQNALTTLQALASGEYNSEAYAAKYKSQVSAGRSFIFIAVILIIAFFLLIKRFEVKRYARLNNIGFWAAWALLNSQNRKHGGTWTDFNSGRGHFGGWTGGGGGGSSGGGFGGFGGGGSFGGGGAGGSW